jgi:nucleoside-diphosphate-sugar epimerase
MVCAGLLRFFLPSPYPAAFMFCSILFQGCENEAFSKDNDSLSSPAQQIQRALITGASGFLGGRLTEMLVAQNVPVRIVVRASSNLDHLAQLPVDVVRGELTDAGVLNGAMQDVSHVFHCAGCSTDWALAATYYEANVSATQALLLAARYAGRLERFLHISTTDVYGYPRVVCDEDHPRTFVGLPYNETKCLGEAAVVEAHEKAGLPVTILRPATIYGPRGTAFVTDIVKLLRERSMALFDHGRERGGFCYVDNVAQAMIEAALSPATIGRTYNITDNTNVTWKKYVAELVSGLGLKQPWLQLPSTLALQAGHAMESAYKYLPLPGRPLLTRHAVLLLSRDQEYPIGRAERDFGYEPAISFAEGMARSIAWARTLVP